MYLSCSSPNCTHIKQQFCILAISEKVQSLISLSTIVNSRMHVKKSSLRRGEPESLLVCTWLYGLQGLLAGPFSICPPRKPSQNTVVLQHLDKTSTPHQLFNAPLFPRRWIHKRNLLPRKLPAARLDNFKSLRLQCRELRRLVSSS